MIPQFEYDVEQDFEIVEEPGLTHKLNHDKQAISGTVDGLEAVKQAIYLILNVERYQHVIYSWNYGIELQDLFGKPKTFVYPELKRRITEALMQDDRIESVDGFSFTPNKNTVTAQFTVHTIFGDVGAERTVNI